jgi:hypothetical protein
LIRDRDLAFAAVGATARAMDVNEVLTAPRSVGGLHHRDERTAA